MKRRTFLAFVPVLPVLSAGCFLKDFTVARPQIEDTTPATSSVQTVRDVAADFDNATDMVISGYGLVEGLNGTGGITPQCEARTAIVERMKRAKIENPAEIIDSPDCAVVIVSAIVKPGVRRDEVIDAEVSLPQGSKVKSLRGGVLRPTPLVTFATQGEVRDYLKQNDIGTISQGNRLLKGQEVAVARGPIQTALAKESDPASAPDDGMKHGFVWKGGKMLESRAMYLILKADEQRYRVAEQVATRINETFHAGDTAGAKVAVARHKDLVAVAVPPRYRLNRPHYMRVALAVPLAAPADLDRYVREWDEKLQRPETTLSAAIRLEAIGAPALPALRAALTSEYPLVKFAAAEALAYQGQTAGADVLKRTAAEHPALQAYALTALAALDDALGMSKLEELLAENEPEVRYGAFRALREVDPNGEYARGEWCRRAFVLHEIGVQGPSLVHMLRSGRSEIVLFGEAPKLLPPFSLTAGPNITVTARAGDTVATVSSFSARSAGSPTHVQSSLAIADILRQMAELGATYADAADMIQKAHDRKALSCPLVLDALPRAVPINELNKAATTDKYLSNEAELLKKAEEADKPAMYSAEKPKRD